MIEVTSFNFFLNSQTLGFLELVDSSDRICIVDIHSIDVVNWCILVEDWHGKGQLHSVKVVTLSV